MMHSNDLVFIMNSSPKSTTQTTSCYTQSLPTTLKLSQTICTFIKTQDLFVLNHIRIINLIKLLLHVHNFALFFSCIVSLSSRVQTREDIITNTVITVCNNR